jgi:hypothetical protein
MNSHLSEQERNELLWAYDRTCSMTRSELLAYVIGDPTTAPSADEVEEIVNGIDETILYGEIEALSETGGRLYPPSVTRPPLPRPVVDELKDRLAEWVVTWNALPDLAWPEQGSVVEPPDALSPLEFDPVEIKVQTYEQYPSLERENLAPCVQRHLQLQRGKP